MNERELRGVLTHIVALDKRMTPADRASWDVMCASWHRLIGHMTHADALDAVDAHYRRPTPPMITTGDILTYARHVTTGPVPITRDRAEEARAAAVAVPMPDHIRRMMPQSLRDRVTALRVPCPHPGCGRPAAQACRNPATGLEAHHPHTSRVTAGHAASERIHA